MVFLLAGASNDLAETRLAKIGGQQPALTGINRAAGVGIDYTALIPATTGDLVGMAPEPSELRAVSPDYK